MLYRNYAVLRDERGVTDYMVAKESGITKSTLSDWKAGRSAPKVEKLMKIADYFGITLDELVRGGNENIGNGCSEETGN